MVGGPSRAGDGPTSPAPQAGVVAVYRALAVRGDGQDGEDGEDGQDGEDGEDGEDGATY